MINHKNEKIEYSISALRRSGHHGIIWWIISQLNSVYYCNNISLKEINKENNPYNIQKNKCNLTKEDQENFNKLKVKRDDKSNYILLNYEDKFISKTFFKNNIRIYIIRNILNWASSREHNSYKGINFKEIDILNYINFYNKAKIDNNCLIISYDNWLSSFNYRDKIALNHLILDNRNENGFGIPSTKSSFGKSNYIDKYDIFKNKTLNRFKQLSNNSLSLIKSYPESLKISLEITPNDNDVYKKNKEVLNEL